MLTPAEATPRALAMLTIAREAFSEDNPGRGQFDEALMQAVLADDNGEIDWQAISVALAMLGHLLLDIIPDELYRSVEASLTETAERLFNQPLVDRKVVITKRVTGDQLLQFLSARAALISGPS